MNGIMTKEDLDLVREMQAIASRGLQFIPAEMRSIAFVMQLQAAILDSPEPAAAAMLRILDKRIAENLSLILERFCNNKFKETIKWLKSDN